MYGLSLVIMLGGRNYDNFIEHMMIKSSLTTIITGSNRKVV